MLAARIHSFGDPSGLRIDTVPEPPEPTGDEIEVAVAASSINGTDLMLRRGGTPLSWIQRLPLVPGFDVAGTVIRCGPEVTAFSPGDQVMALLPHSGGGQAERIVLEQDRAARVPSSCSLAAAAALPLAGLTALQALYGKAALPARTSPTVLVLGAAGGIGSYAVQLARRVGAEVTGVASGPKLDYVAGLGASDVLDYREADPVQLGRRWDVILDAPARLTYADARPALTDDGVLVSTRPISLDAVRQLVPGPRRNGSASFTAVATKARSEDLAHLAALVDRGELRPTLDRTFPLAEIAAAHAYAESEVRGKVVVAVSAR